MDNFKDAHYFHIPSQGNVYTMTEVKLANGNTLILAASLKRDIFCFEYLEGSQGGLVPTTKEVSFTYIPSGAEIISIDAFNKSNVNNELVIGITIIKNSNDSDTLENFLNIYSQLEEHEDFDIENIAHNCLTVELNFIPYKLLHTELISWNYNKIVGKELVFLLSGSDHLVHAYHENPSEHIYKEMETKDRFPEFTKFPSPVVWIDICHINNYEERITALGCECGYVKFLKINTKTNKLVYNFSTKFDNFISNVCLSVENGSSLEKFSKATQKLVKTDKKDIKPIVNLVVVNSILPPVLFCDILTYGLSDYTTLARHDNCNIFTSCIVSDIDFDGHKEILIGTSSEEIVLYKKDLKDSKWYLEELKQLAAPVLSMKYTDLCGDGIRELIIFSLKGIHVLQHDPQFVQKRLKDKIDSLVLPKIEALAL